MFRNLRVNEFVSARLERCESALLVNAHQATVASNVGCEDRGQPPFDTRLAHNIARPTVISSRVYGWERSVSIKATMSDLGQSLRVHGVRATSV